MTVTSESTSATDETTTRDTTETSFSLLVLDAPPAVQEWVDQYGTALAEALEGEDHTHQTRTVVLTLSQLWRVIEASVRNEADTGPWSIATSGLPPFPEEPTNPDSGNWLHNACHAVGICR